MIPPPPTQKHLCFFKYLFFFQEQPFYDFPEDLFAYQTDNIFPEGQSVCRSNRCFVFKKPLSVYIQFPGYPSLGHQTDGLSFDSPSLLCTTKPSIFMLCFVQQRFTYFRKNDVLTRNDKKCD